MIKQNVEPENGDAGFPLQTIVMPDICTSMHGCEPPREHCMNCSHAYFQSHVFANGKAHFFEFNPIYGVQFLTSKGKVRKRQPGEKAHVWKEWELWRKKRFAS